MIKTEITAYITSYEFNGEIVVPSQVMTSTPQEQQLNLSYSPNFTMRVEDTYSYLNVTDKVEATFTADDTQYTAYMRVLNRAGNTVTLQYVDGLVSSDAPEPEPEPSAPYFTSPVDGDTITETLSEEYQEFTYPIELEYGDGTPIPYDITSQYVTCDNSDVTIEPTEGVDENDQTYISAVYMHIQLGTGTATLTYEDPDTGDTCTATFDYDITAAQPEPEPQSISISISSDSPMNVGDVYTFSVTTDLGDDVTADCSYEYDDACLAIDGSAGTIECIALHPDGLTAFQATYTTGSGELQALQYVSTDVPSSGGGSGASSIYTWPDSFTFTGVKTSLNGDMWFDCGDNTARFSVFDDLQNDVSQDVRVYFSAMHVYDGQAEEQDIDVASDFEWSVAFDTQDILVKAPMEMCNPDYVLNGNPTLSIVVEYNTGESVLTTSIPVTLQYIDLDDGGQHTIEFNESSYSCEKTINGNDVTYDDAPFNIVVDGNDVPKLNDVFTFSGMNNVLELVDIQTEIEPDLWTTVGYAFRAVYAQQISTSVSVSATYGSTTIQASVHLTVTVTTPR